ncbi:hypothetical protein [Vibrio crassostreae]|uniref:hypothetical protein n=1 Tax=Vibrio crassostreae TaxID=246167 RepID=UPI001B307EF8|nr:hypothetical protein [Vibrio crassostreae]
MKSIKTLLTIALLAVSTQASAYVDILGNYKAYTTIEEVRKVDQTTLKTDLQKFEYSYSKTIISHSRGKETVYAKELMPSAEAELKELHSKGFTPASLTLGMLEIGRIKQRCEKSEYQAKCLSKISPVVEGYLIPVANEDESGQAAALLSGYYLNTYTDKGREKNYEWSRIGKEKMVAYRKEWSKTGERPKPTFLKTDEEKEQEKSFFSW